MLPVFTISYKTVQFIYALYIFSGTVEATSGLKNLYSTRRKMYTVLQKKYTTQAPAIILTAVVGLQKIFVQ